MRTAIPTRPVFLGLALAACLATLSTPASADFERGALTLFEADNPPGGATVDGRETFPVEWWGATDVPFQSRGAGAIPPVNGGRIKLKRFGAQNQLSVLLENLPNRLTGNLVTSIGFARVPGGTLLPFGPSRGDRLLTVSTSSVGLGFSVGMRVHPTGSADWIASGASVGGTCAVGAAAATPVTLPEHGVSVACRVPAAGSDLFTLEVTTADSASCQHPPSAIGPRLVDGCSDCARAVCAVDAFCCSTTWDSICVARATGTGGFAPHCTGGATGSPAALREPFPSESRVAVFQELGATVLGSYPYLPAEGFRTGGTGLASKTAVSTWKRITSSGRSRDLKVLTWNVKRFTDQASELEAALTLPAGDFFSDAAVTACEIGRRIGDTGAEIVALEEAWDQKELVTLRSCANVRRGELGLPPFIAWTASGEGISNLSDPDALPSGSPEFAGALIGPGGVVIMTTYEIMSSQVHVFSACKADDCLAQKGVVHARINLGSRPDDPPAAGDPINHDNGRYSPSADEFIDVFAAHMNAPGDFTTCQHTQEEIAEAFLDTLGPFLETVLAFASPPPDVIEGIVMFVVNEVAQRGCTPGVDGDIFPDMAFLRPRLSLTAADVITAQHAEARDFILSQIADARDRPAIFLGDFNTDEGFPTDTAVGTPHRRMRDVYQAAPPGETPLSAPSAFDGVFDFDIDVFAISQNPFEDTVPIKRRACTGAPGVTCTDTFFWPLPTAANAGTDFSKPLSAGDDCGAASSAPSSGGGKLDYITYVKPLASPRFVIRPLLDPEGFFVHRRMDIAAGGGCMSDHYGMEATFRWFRNFESDAFDSRLPTSWVLDATHVSSQDDDGWFAVLDFYGNFFGPDSTAGSFVCSDLSVGPAPGLAFFPAQGREILDEPVGWESAFTRPGGTGPANDWLAALLVNDDDDASADDAFDLSRNVPGVWETTNAMRFGFHQVLGGEVQMLTLHDDGDAPGTTGNRFVNRIAPYTIADTGSERLCDAAGGFGTARWVVTPSQ